MEEHNSSEHNDRKSVIKKVIIGSIGVAAGVAAMLYLFICALLPTHAPSAVRPQTGAFSTVKGEHRCETLPEASRVCLNTDSVVRYAFSGHTRNVELVSGEASFEVQTDPRPFDVLAGRVLIRDISTSFLVRKKNSSTLVTVIQGRVRLIGPIDDGLRSDFNRDQPELAWKAAPEFHRLQQVEFDEPSRTLREGHVLSEQDLSQLLAWQRGRIDLTNKSLREALTEFSRYQPIEKFTFQDKELRRLRVGGELEATHLSDFLDSLTAVYGIQHTMSRDRDGQTVVNLSLPRSAGNHSQQK